MHIAKCLVLLWIIERILFKWSYISMKHFEHECHSHIGCSGWMNGLGICSMRSVGHISTTAVPLHTTSPRLRVSSVSLNGSSASVGMWGVRSKKELRTMMCAWHRNALQIKQLLLTQTLDMLYASIQHQVQQRIITLQNTSGCMKIYRKKSGGYCRESLAECLMHQVSAPYRVTMWDYTHAYF